MSNAELSGIAEALKNGAAPQQVTVRDFLSWFGDERKGSQVVRKIRAALKGYGLKTTPDLTYRFDGLEAAKCELISVAPDNSLAKATTIMLCNDYSQLPVMTSERTVKGMISWKSIGTHRSHGKECNWVRDCMWAAKTVASDSSLFAAIDTIAKHDYVLVQNHEKVFTGIVTASDLSQQFGQLAEPFLRIGEIENHVRWLLQCKFTVEQLGEVISDPQGNRTVEGVSDLTFGGYIRLLENEGHWGKLNLTVDRSVFVERLEAVRGIRNDVMHFGRDGLSEGALTTLRTFASFLQTLHEIG